MALEMTKEKPATSALAGLPLVRQMAAEYNFGTDLDRFETTLIKTVFPSDKPVTNSQLLMFLGVAQAYKLNPFIREIFAFPSKGGGITPIVSIDGWISMVQRQELYNGHKFVYEWKDGKVGGDLLAATCLIHRKDLAYPIEHTEFMEECARGTDVWAKWPRRMLTHKTFIQCARYAFGFSGIYDEDEGERILEGTLKPTGAGAMTAEIAMPRRTEALTAGEAQKPKEPEARESAVEEPDRSQDQGQDRGQDAVPPAQEAQAPDAQLPIRELQTLFDEGLVQKGTARVTIGRGRANRLLAILAKAKAHTEQELHDEFLKPLQATDLAELPLDLYDRVCAWAEGKLEDRG